MGTWMVEMQALADNPDTDCSQEMKLEGIKTSIYKVPPVFISRIARSSYQPQMVSFGPYHHGNPELASMEAHKQAALVRYIRQSKRSLSEVFQVVMEVAQDLKDSYDSLNPEWRDNIEIFVQLMIADGCFMLELLQSHNFGNNPVVNKHGNLHFMPFIKADMLLLENQLPMLLLLKLKYILENTEPNIEALNKDILKLLHYDITDGGDSKMGKCLHVLHLYHQRLLHAGGVGPPSPNQEGKDKRFGHNVIRPATKLHLAGVRFMKSESKSLWDITFNDGILKLPNFIVDDRTESIFMNLIAFESCHIPAGSHITTFVAFMDRIINNNWDIKLLSMKGIIDNNIGTDNEAADLFKRMSSGLSMEMNDNLAHVWTDIINYCNMPWNKWRAFIMEYYAIISIISALIAFCLTVLQTIFSILK